MTQEFLDKELYSGMGGPRYGYEPREEVKPKGDLYSFLPSGWGTGAAAIDSKRQQEIMAQPQSQEQEMGQYFPQMSGPQYYHPSEDYESDDDLSYDEGEEFEEAFVNSAVPQSATAPVVTAPVTAKKPPTQTTTATASASKDQKGKQKEPEQDKEKEKQVKDPIPNPKQAKHSERVPWVEDKYAASCIKCTREFTTFRRRHHCRGCGKVFCALCSDYRLLLPKEMGYKVPQRTCYACFKEFSSIDFSIDHDIFGPPGAPLVVLLHGATATRRAFGLQAPHMLWHYRVLMVDLPGHGSKEKDPFTLEAAVKLVSNFIVKYSTDGAALIVGYSLGAYVAMAVAGTHPELVKGLVVIGAGTEAPTVNNLLGLPGLMAKTVPNFMLYKAYTYIHNAELKDFLMEELYAYPGCYDKCLEAVKNALSGVKFIDYLKKFTGPTLFIIGQNDCSTSLESWVQAAQNGNVQVIEGAHPLILADERYYPRVNEVLVEFMDNVEAVAIKMMKVAEEKKVQEEVKRVKSGPFNESEFIKQGDWLFDGSAGKDDGTGGQQLKDLSKNPQQQITSDDDGEPVRQEVELQNFTSFAHREQESDQEVSKEEVEQEVEEVEEEVEEEGEEEVEEESDEADTPSTNVEYQPPQQQSTGQQTEPDEDEYSEEEDGHVEAPYTQQSQYLATPTFVSQAPQQAVEEGSEEEEEEEEEGESEEGEGSADEEEQVQNAYAPYQPTAYGFPQVGGGQFYGGYNANPNQLMYNMQGGVMGGMMMQGYGGVPMYGGYPSVQQQQQQYGEQEEEEETDEEEEYSEEEGEAQ